MQDISPLRDTSNVPSVVSLEAYRRACKEIQIKHASNDIRKKLEDMKNYMTHVYKKNIWNIISGLFLVISIFGLLYFFQIIDFWVKVMSRLYYSENANEDGNISKNITGT